MKLTTRMRAWMARGLVKAMGVTWVPDWMRYSFMLPTFRALVREGYAANGAVFACVSALAFAFIEPTLRVYETKNGSRVEVENHPLTLKLRQPNAQMGMLELLIFTIIYLAVGGNAYWYKVRSKGKQVAEIWVLSDAQLTPVPGKTTLVDHYELIGENGALEPIPAEDIVHFKWLIDAERPWRGQAPLGAVAREVDTDNEVGRYLYTLLKNDAVPRIALIAPKDADVIDDPTYKRMRERWMDRQGGDNRGMPAILEGGLDIKTVGLDLKQLAFEGLRGVPETRIAAALRVPMSVAGLGAGLNPTYANKAGDEKSFTQRTLVPLWRLLESEITADMLPEFDKTKGREVAFDLSTVAALKEDLKDLRTWALDALAKGGIMLNEFRAFVGLAPDKNGDIYLRAMTTVEVTSGQSGGSTGGKSLQIKSGSRTYSAKSLRNAQRAIAARRKIVAKATTAMGKDVDAYFASLAKTVRTRVADEVGKQAGQRANAESKTKASTLVTAADDAELEKVVKRWYVKIIELSWDTWNSELGATLDFELTDPAVNRVLQFSGKRIKDINDTTRSELQDVLRYGEAHGWSIDDFVRGDPDKNIPGIMDLVEETYVGRSETIARTELGFAQNIATTGRYAEAGVKDVLVLDNGLDDDDQPCQDADGQIWTVEQAEENPLEHPKCTRGFGAVFEA
jgi:HK97 family phage portal protein